MGAQLIDLDAQLEAEMGCTIARFFEQQGETAFRALEQKALLAALDGPQSVPLVISVGGGALLDRSTRIEVLDRATVITLSASVDEILRRVQQQDGLAGAVRPLLAGPDPRARIEQLLAQRQEAYRECHGEIATEGKTAQQVAECALAIADENTTVVATGNDAYRVWIGAGLIEPRLPGLLAGASGTLLVSDTNVSPLHGDKARRALASSKTKSAQVLLVPGEEHKNLAGLSQIFEGAFDSGLDRKALFVGLGGGVVTDMTGFAAASWVRGVRWVAVPTTLLSMVDASVGGKTAVDFRTAKNSVGAFWQPQGVLCDVETLLTETDRAYIGALSEVVKTALIGDAPLLDILEQKAEMVRSRDRSLMTEVVRRCVRVKARIVAQDERESGVRAHLNLGHTIGHALEAASGFTGLTHGEAVSLGLVAALRLGQRKGHTPEALTARVLSLLQRLGLPYQLAHSDLVKCSQLLGHDKKRSGDSVRFIFAAEPGKVFGESTPLSEVQAAAPGLADDAS